MTADNRQELRLNSEESVFLELAAASPCGTHPQEIIQCRSLNVSANGLQISLDQPLQENILLQLAIALNDQASVLEMVAEVKWCRQASGLTRGTSTPSEAPTWQVGLALLESDNTKLLRWKQLMSSRLIAN